MPNRFHVALSRRFDLPKMIAEADAGLAPRQGVAILADLLRATVHEPPEASGTPLDKLCARIVGRPAHWVMGRELARELGPEDVIYGTGEEVMFPLAARFAKQRRQGRGPRVATFIHNVDRPRARLAVNLFRLASKVDLFVTNTTTQVDFLKSTLKIPDSRIHFDHDQTDARFFTPGPPSPGKTRPIIVGVGLEQRDYRTLAAATADLDIDVRISAHSRDASASSRNLPDVLPANMSQKFYAWPDLVQLYRDADIVAVPVLPNLYTAGISTLMEASACRRPIVATRTEGLAYHLEPGAVVGVPPQDPEALKSAILSLLADPAAAEAMADRALVLGQTRYSTDRFTAALAERLARL